MGTSDYCGPSTPYATASFRYVWTTVSHCYTAPVSNLDRMPLVPNFGEGTCVRLQFLLVYGVTMSATRDAFSTTDTYKITVITFETF